MSKRQTYKLIIEWKHRTFGPQMEKVTAEGTSIRRAISNGLLGFFSGLSKRNRRDAHAAISVKAIRQKREAAK